jgi:hypothetical protein
VKLRARWSGLPPRVGDYLASPTRPRFAYRVCDVRNVDSLVRWDPAQKKELRRLAIEVDRLPIAELPTTARVHDWNWDKRGSARALTS